MTATISRMQFLRGDFSGKSKPVHPPWALSELLFLDQCNGCGDCIGACPEHILVKSYGAYPVVDFSLGGCLLCGDCARTCRTGALRTPVDQPWNLRAFIGEGCVANLGVECRTCRDQCETGAIRFHLQVGGPALPELDPAVCSGCGFCYSACPMTAIELRNLAEE